MSGATSVDSVVNSTFVQRFQGLAAAGSGSSSSQLLSALKGEASSKTSISDGLRYGAQTFVTSLKLLNSTVNLVNLSEQKLQDLSKLTDKMIDLASRATETGIGSQGRAELDRQFKELGNQFKKTIDDATVGQRDVLNQDDLSQIFQSAGLDKENSDSIAAVFSQFVLSGSDQSLASDKIKGDRPIYVPRSSKDSNSRLSPEPATLIAGDADLRTRPDATRTLVDLKALKEQITKNIGALDQGLSVIKDNMDLVRATGLAFLSISSQITSSDDAGKVAAELRAEIRKNAGASIAQAENLQPIVIATLALQSAS